MMTTCSTSFVTVVAVAQNSDDVVVVVSVCRAGAGAGAGAAAAGGGGGGGGGGGVVLMGAFSIANKQEYPSILRGFMEAHSESWVWTLASVPA